MPGEPIADAEDLRIQLNMREIHVERASQLIAAASDLVKAYCRGRQFVRRENEVVTLDGTGNRIVVLPDYPVESVSQVVIDGVELDTSLYEWSENGTIRRLGGSVWPRNYRIIEVTYTHGPAEGVMADVRGVVLAIAGRAYTFRTDVENSIGDEPLSEASGFAPDMLMLPSERRVLDAHRDVLG